MKNMNDELLDALDGLFAYDTGCVSSGIKDEGLRTRVIAELREMPEKQLADVKASLYAEPPYGPEDRVKFSHWLDEQLA